MQIKQLRKLNNMTQKELADKLSLTPKAISFYEKEQRFPSKDILLKMSKIFEVSIDYILGNDSQETKGIMIPVLGRVSAGIPLETVTDILDYEEIPKEWASKGEYFALKIKGDSMFPRIVENDVVIVKKQSDVDSGDIGVVLINGEDATVKKIKTVDSGIFLIPLNQLYEPIFYTNEDIEKLPISILGKMVELRGKF